MESGEWGKGSITKTLVLFLVFLSPVTEVESDWGFTFGLKKGVHRQVYSRQWSLYEVAVAFTCSLFPNSSDHYDLNTLLGPQQFKCKCVKKHSGARPLSF
jgi:hypothetical protein